MIPKVGWKIFLNGIASPSVFSHSSLVFVIILSNLNQYKYLNVQHTRFLTIKCMQQIIVFVFVFMESKKGNNTKVHT